MKPARAGWLHVGRQTNVHPDSSPSMKLSIVAAMAANRVIGDGPRIPWRIPGEQQIFKRLTQGNVLTMGRKTFESIGRALPNRTTIVISRQPKYTAAGCSVVASFEDAIAHTRRMGREELFVAGGAEIFALAMPLTQTIHLTEIHRTFDGDAYFPLIDASFSKFSAEDVAGATPYSYCVYVRNARA